MFHSSTDNTTTTHYYGGSKTLTQRTGISTNNYSANDTTHTPTVLNNKARRHSSIHAALGQWKGQHKATWAYVERSTQSLKVSCLMSQRLKVSKSQSLKVSSLKVTWQDAASHVNDAARRGNQGSAARISAPNLVRHDVQFQLVWASTNIRRISMHLRVLKLVLRTVALGFYLC